MKKFWFIFSVAAICVAMSACSSDGADNTTSGETGPIFINAGDNENDTVGEVVSAVSTTSTTPKNDAEDVATETGDKVEIPVEEDTHADGIIETDKSVKGHWADIEGNILDIVPNEVNQLEACVELVNSDTYYMGGCSTDNKTYITIDVTYGIENGEEIIQEVEEVEEDEEDETLDYSETTEEIDEEPEDIVIKTVTFKIISLSYDEEGQLQLSLSDSKGEVYTLMPYAPLNDYIDGSLGLIEEIVEE